MKETDKKGAFIMSKKMLTVYKYELKARLSSLSGWLYMAISLLFIAGFVSVMNLLGGYSNAEYALETATYGLGFASALLLALSVSADRKRGATAWLIGRISALDIVMGKYLAALTLLCVPVVLAAVVPLVLCAFGSVNFVSAYWGVVGYALYGAAVLAVCTFFSYKITKPVFAFLANIAVIAVTTVCGNLAGILSNDSEGLFFGAFMAVLLIIGCVLHFYLENVKITLAYSVLAIAAAAVTALTGGSAAVGRWVLKAVSLSAPLAELTYGTASLAAAFKLLFIPFIFILLSVLMLKRERGELGKKLVASVCAASVAAAVVFCFLVTLLPVRAVKYDTTSTGLFTLSSVTEENIRALSRDVEISVACENYVPGKLSAERLLERYESFSDKITIKVIKPSESQQYSSLADGSIIVRAGERTAVIEAHELLACSDEAYTAAYDYYYYFAQQGIVSGSFAGFMAEFGEELGLYDNARYELMITSAVKYVTSDAATVGRLLVVTGHGETALNSTTVTSLKPWLIFCDGGSLKNGIPAGVDTVLISDPTSDISEDEYNILNGFLNGGGSLVLTTSYGKTEELSRLMQLCGEYGLTTDHGFLCEGNESYTYQGYHQILMSAIDTGLLGEYAPTLENPVLTGGGTGIRISAIDGIETKNLVKTTSSAYTIQNVEERENADFVEGTDEKGEFSIAAIAENTATGGTVAWFSSAAFNLEAYDSIVYGSNFSVFTATLAMLAEAEPRLDIPSRSIVSSPLEVSQAVIYAGFSVSALVPCAIFGVGGARIYLRGRKADELYGV